jgi:hypothetical protein
VREPVFIEGARLAPLVHASWNYAPLDTQSGVMVWLYNVRENLQSIANNPSVTSPQPYLVFASGHLAFWGDPHHDVHLADFSNAI